MLSIRPNLWFLSPNPSAPFLFCQHCIHQWITYKNYLSTKEKNLGKERETGYKIGKRKKGVNCGGRNLLTKYINEPLNERPIWEEILRNCRQTQQHDLVLVGIFVHGKLNATTYWLEDAKLSPQLLCNHEDWMSALSNHYHEAHNATCQAPHGDKWKCLRKRSTCQKQFPRFS